MTPVPGNSIPSDLFGKEIHSPQTYAQIKTTNVTIKVNRTLTKLQFILQILFLPFFILNIFHFRVNIDLLNEALFVHWE